MIFQGFEKELGAIYQANRIENDEIAYGIAVIVADKEKSFLIQRFETNDSVDDAPGIAYYVGVKTESVSLIK